MLHTTSYSLTNEQLLKSCFENTIVKTQFHNFNWNCVFKTRFHMCVPYIVCNYHHSSLCAIFRITTYHVRSGGTDCCIMHLKLLKYLKSFDFWSLSWLFEIWRVIVMGSWYFKSCRNLKVLSRKWFDSKKVIDKFRLHLRLSTNNKYLDNIKSLDKNWAYMLIKKK